MPDLASELERWRLKAKRCGTCKRHVRYRSAKGATAMICWITMDGRKANDAPCKNYIRRTKGGEQ